MNNDLLRTYYERKYTELLSLYRAGYPAKVIAKRLGCNANTVCSVIYTLQRLFGRDAYPTFREMQINIRRQRVAELYAQQLTPHDIAERLQWSYRTILHDLRALGIEHRRRRRRRNMWWNDNNEESE